MKRNKQGIQSESDIIMKVDVSHPDKQNVFFTSDLHFNHKNVIEYAHRPFSSVEEMNEELIIRWNNTVRPNDLVFILGDVVYGNATQCDEILSQLNGKKYLILGNHDIQNYHSTVFQKHYERIEQQMILRIGEQHTLILNHYPMLAYAGTYKKNKNVFQLFGHVHTEPLTEGLDAERMKHLFPMQYDVGVDNNNYRPISYNQLKKVINKQIRDAKERLSEENGV